MKTQSDVVIVSVFGRGNWLARQLKKQGLNVVLVDVSQQMGRWAAEDHEGPFGFFRYERLENSQLERLFEDAPEESVDQGLTIWLKDGPIEMKGPLSSYSLDQFGISSQCQEYLLRYESLSESERSQFRSELQGQDFSKNWLAQLAHQLAGNTYLPNSKSLECGRPLPIFSPYFFRRVSRRSFEKGVELCRMNGVTVYESKILDMAYQKRTLEGLEVTGEHSGIIFGKRFVWMLSGEETQRLPKNLDEVIYPSGVANPSWVWMRFRLSIDPGFAFQALPQKFVMIEDLCLPWTHDNLCLVEKTVKTGDVDAWMKVPTKQRFHKAYIESLVSKLCESFSKRMAGVEIEVSQMPQDYLYDHSEMGASCFPVYDQESLDRFRGDHFENVDFDGAETWQGLDWLSRFRAQEKIEKKIVQWSRKKNIENQDSEPEAQI